MPANEKENLELFLHMVETFKPDDDGLKIAIKARLNRVLLKPIVKKPEETQE